MGLDMKSRQKITGEVSSRYRDAGKKEKSVILNEFVQTTGYSRKYAIHILKNYGKKCTAIIDGKPVEIIASAKERRKGGGRKPKYGDDVIDVVRKIWEFFDYQCGTLLAPMIRLMLECLASDLQFGITDSIKEKLKTISASTIDRRLKHEREKIKIKGRSLTKSGELLKNQIAVRTFFAWDERKPGYFELDTVSHCGANSSGQFCSTLTLTDVYSGWTIVRGLRNRAHMRVRNATDEERKLLPFVMRGIDSDNGGEFINLELKMWCEENGIEFTRSRPYRKNDNCFVEQKNGDIVRKTVGYYRYDTDAETEALEDVYRHFCPLNNFWYPSLKIIRKDRDATGKLKKVYDVPKTPYHRLLESSDLPESVKDELKRRAVSINPIEQKRLQNRALSKLLKLNAEKNIEDTNSKIKTESSPENNSKEEAESK
jgi:hypothetical protein